MANNNIIEEKGKPVPLKIDDWHTKGFDTNLSKQPTTLTGGANFIAGSDFDALLDEMLFNRMLRLKDLRKKPQGNEPGKMYWDGDNKKYKIWIDEIGQWADVVYTSTSTSTSTTSSSSSTSTTSTSTSTTSTSTSTT